MVHNFIGRFSATHQYLHSTTHSFRLQSYYIFLTPTNIFSKKTQKKTNIFLAIVKYMFNNIFLSIFVFQQELFTTYKLLNYDLRIHSSQQRQTDSREPTL